MRAEFGARWLDGGGEARGAFLRRFDLSAVPGADDSATDLIVGLRRLGLPAEIAEIALLMYRFLFLLGDTAMAMDWQPAAWLIFGADRRLRSLGLLIANLLPRALGRARRLEVGLAARGWNGEMRVLSKRIKTSMPFLGLVLLVEAAIAATGIYLSSYFARSSWIDLIQVAFPRSWGSIFGLNAVYGWPSSVPTALARPPCCCT